jgi:hypothetical protein
MNILRTIAILASLALVIPAVAFGQTADPEKLAADQVACQQHASSYSGYNPAAPPPPQASSSSPQRGAGLRGGARGAARGAVAGGVVESIDDDGDRDQATEMGAAVGGMRGASKSRRAAKAQATTAPPPPSGDPNAYAESFDECMTGKGYPKSN